MFFNVFSCFFYVLRTVCVVVFFSVILLCSIKSVQFSSVQLVGRQKAHRSVKIE